MSASDKQLFFGSVAALGALSAGLAFRMTAYRLAGSPGEGKPSSAMSRVSERQLLNAEWAPLGAALGVALWVQGAAPEWTARLMALFTATRFIFAAALLVPEGARFGVVLPTMVTCYGATFAMAGLLAASA